ncbi:MAG: undecaprenyl/decaprenyl-phosphate alpha-N-acetylglucosaminyl 1-phosphate transferase [Peptostreptococcaceae bacterium]|jgi:UDP-GlcNAc:undecaprenyl-phosphate GlcNAc-1-phosphate transferase|nr:undecaprenyl/decaprenyl-phosphate alpha-N-acetylglucosaminyl 1-phosphate transferase [Peptostreptococcaceae bacterium]
MDKLLIAFLIAFLVSYFSMPFVKKLAYKINAIDVPKDNRRVHKKPIPRLGGVAIFLGFSVALIISLDISTKLIGLLIGISIIILLGIIDDVKEISAKIKLLGQIIAAFVVILFGIKINFVTNPFVFSGGDYLYLGYLSIPITIIWIVGITNTVNLIDGLDGLAGGVSAISAITLTFIAFYNKQYDAAILLIALAGGALGFLPYNFNPAKIFMGDTGALFLGYVLAVVSIEGVIKSYAALAIFVPVLALGLPIFDTTFAIVRRAMNKKPIMQADKGHLHHRLLDKGLSQKQTVLIMYAISCFLGISAVVLTQASKFECIMVIVLNLIIITYGIKRLKLLSSIDE